MRRVRVLRVIARMNVGGPALQVVGLVRGLDPGRFEHRVLVGEVERGEADYLALRAPDVPVVRVDGLGRSVRVGGDLRALRRIIAEIRGFRPDIVHTHTAKAGVLGRVAAIVCGVPHVVHTFHGHLLHGYFSPASTRAIVALERALARRTDRLVAVGSRVRDELLAAGIGRPEQYVVVPPGVELPPPPPRDTARAALGLPADHRIVSFVGRLSRVKRPDRFVEVARRVTSRRAGVTFAVAGEGQLFDDLRARAASLGEGIRLLGWRADVETVYAASDVIVLTSDNEGMPVSLIEAALAGRPAVSTDVGSAAEVVADGTTGYVTSSSVDDIARALTQLLDDDELRARFGRAAQERARQRFGVARLVADTEGLYRSLMDGEVPS